MEKEADDERRNENSPSWFLRLVRSIRSAVRNGNECLQQWVHERGRFTQLLIGATLSAVAGGLANAVETALNRLSLQQFLLSEKQLLVPIVAVICGQTFVQARKFNQLRHTNRNVNDTSAKRADGGRHVDAEEAASRAGPLGNGTTGGGLVGGAIAGAGIGSSWGLGGVVGGAIFGAVLGDVLESFANVD